MGTQYHNSGRQQSQTQITLKEMKSDMISFRTLSNQRQNGYYVSAQDSDQWTTNNRVATLKGQTSRLNNGVLTSTFQTAIKVHPGTNSQRQFDKIVHSNRILHGREYQYNAQLSTRHQAVYTQIIKGRPILDHAGQLRLHINANNEVTGYTQGYLSNFKTLRPRALTISQQQAVTWLYRHNQIANNSRIRHVIFGYDKVEKNGRQAVYVPVWYVNVKSKAGDTVQHLRVNAFSGTSFKMNGDN